MRIALLAVLMLLVSAGAVALIVSGRVFGILELFLVGTAAGLLVVLCAALVALTRLRLEVSRDLHPARVHAGTPSRVCWLDPYWPSLPRPRDPVLRDGVRSHSPLRGSPRLARGSLLPRRPWRGPANQLPEHRIL